MGDVLFFLGKCSIIVYRFIFWEYRPHLCVFFERETSNTRSILLNFEHSNIRGSYDVLHKTYNNEFYNTMAYWDS